MDREIFITEMPKKDVIAALRNGESILVAQDDEPNLALWQRIRPGISYEIRSTTKTWRLRVTLAVKIEQARE